MHYIRTAADDDPEAAERAIYHARMIIIPRRKIRHIRRQLTAVITQPSRTND